MKLYEIIGFNYFIVFEPWPIPTMLFLGDAPGVGGSL